MNDLAVKQAEGELQFLEKSAPLDLTGTRRQRRIAEEDLARFLKVDRPMSKKSADFTLKMARQHLEYQEEELRQLEKMYKADDLTEETEEIILKRARNAVEQAKFTLEIEKVYHDRMVKLNLPRREESVKESAQRSAILWNKVKATLPLAMEKERLELDKLKLERARAKEKLQKLLADRATMSVKAPAAGVVYYGRCIRGKFSGAASLANNLRRGGSLAAGQVFMTVVKPRPMFIRAAVPEKHLQYVRAGLKGTASPTGYPDLKLAARIRHVAAVPTSSGSFDSRINVALDRQAQALMPGMTCKVKLVPYVKKNVLTVPPKAVPQGSFGG